MTATVHTADVHEDVVKPIDWRAPISFTVFSIVAFFAFGLNGASEEVVFSWSSKGTPSLLPDFTTDARALGITVGVVMLLITAATIVMALRRITISGWIVVAFSLLFLIGLLAWVGAGGRVPIVYLLTGAIAFSVPVVLGALAGAMGERAGVTNIAIEGQLLMGAFTAAFVGTITGNLILAMFAGMLSGALVGALLAVFSVKYHVDQIIVGVVVNVLVTGITSFLHSSLMTRDEQAYNYPGTLKPIPIPLLSEIPVIGPVLFNQRITTYLMFALVIFVTVLLYKTRTGLRLRAVGEHPLAADTVGINVNRTRFWVVTLSGLIAGLGGVALSIGSVGGFIREMSAGQGYIALACVILGRWNPLAATAAAFLFGFSKQFGVWAAQAGAGIPTDFINMIPYIVTLIAVGGFVGRSIAPAAVNKPYVK